MYCTIEVENKDKEKEIRCEIYGISGCLESIHAYGDINRSLLEIVENVLLDEFFEIEDIYSRNLEKINKKLQQQLAA